MELVDGDQCSHPFGNADLTMRILYQKRIPVYGSFKLRELLYSCQKQDNKLLHNILHNNLLIPFNTQGRMQSRPCLLVI